MNKSISLLLVLVLVVPEVLDAQSLPSASPETVGMSSQRLQGIGEAMRREVSQGRTPGAVIAIARRGKLVYHEAFGFIDKNAGTPMPKDAIFAIASMTKPLTTVGALRLVEQGRLLLNEPVGRYLPQLDGMPVAVMSTDGRTIQRTEPAMRKPTLQDLMRHTAGVTNGDGSSELHKLYAPLSLTLNPDLTGPAFLDKLGALPLHYQPGTKWDYSLGLDVLGLVVEAVTKERLGRYLDERMFKPLGMGDTGFVVPASKVGRYAKLADSVEPTLRNALDRTKAAATDCGGGCAVSTAADYLRFAQMLLNKGSLYGNRILGRKTVEFMTSEQLSPEVNLDRLNQYPNLNGGYGFGLGVAVRRGSGVAGIMGSPGDYHWGGGSGTYFWVDPKEELIVVFMAAAPAPASLYNRQLITSLVLQAITD